MNKKNPFEYEEKPYYTDEELKLRYKITIDEAMKQGNVELAKHYRTLLDMLENGTTQEILDKIEKIRNKK